MRRPRSRLRRTTVLLLLALRTRERSIRPKGGLCRSRGFREGPVGAAPSHGRVPPEGRARVCAEASPDRGFGLHDVYLYLGVCGCPHSTSPMAAVRGVRLPCPIAVR